MLNDKKNLSLQTNHNKNKPIYLKLQQIFLEYDDIGTVNPLLEPPGVYFFDLRKKGGFIRRWGVY